MLFNRIHFNSNTSKTLLNTAHLGTRNVLSHTTASLPNHNNKNNKHEHHEHWLRTLDRLRRRHHSTTATMLNATRTRGSFNPPSFDRLRVQPLLLRTYFSASNRHGTSNPFTMRNIDTKTKLARDLPIDLRVQSRQLKTIASKPEEMDLKYLAGVGPKRAEVLGKAGLNTVADLLYYFPRRYIVRTNNITISDLGEYINSNAEVTLVGTVQSCKIVTTKMNTRMCVVEVVDNSCFQFNGRRIARQVYVLRCLFFGGAFYLKKNFRKGSHFAFHGKVKLDTRPSEDGLTTFVMSHPSVDKVEMDDSVTPQAGEEEDSEEDAFSAEHLTSEVTALYPLRGSFTFAGITSKFLRKVMKNVFAKNTYIQVQETLPQWVQEKHGLLDLTTALRLIHLANTTDEIEKALRRIKFDEFLYMQLYFTIQKHARDLETMSIENKYAKKFLIPKKSQSLTQKLLSSLPFKLTNAQKQAINHIAKDVTSGRQMTRLLQGDVGCGKTIVAVAAMTMAIDSGFQAILMAPTEILCQQHAASVSKLLAPLGVKVVTMLGTQKKPERDEVIRQLQDGTAQICIGTHALIYNSRKRVDDDDDVDLAREDSFSPAEPYESYEGDNNSGLGYTNDDRTDNPKYISTFKNLGLVIIDEQHRFGVEQRARLLRGVGGGTGDEPYVPPHTLMMSATPIPRSLAMSLYGDLDITIINELPANRLPIKTLLFNVAKPGPLRCDGDVASVIGVDDVDDNGGGDTEAKEQDDCDDDNNSDNSDEEPETPEHMIHYRSSRKEVFRFLRDNCLSMGNQAYFVFPLVQESEKMDNVFDAESAFEEIQKEFEGEFRVGLVHGKQHWSTKQQEMEKFKNHELDILVSTTVIEVGVDVPFATAIVIENAERFGLSTLHQLRGRVGRSDLQSYCILINNAGVAKGQPNQEDTTATAATPTDGNSDERDSAAEEAEASQAGTVIIPGAGEANSGTAAEKPKEDEGSKSPLQQLSAAEQRLKIMTETNDGFVISTTDLKLRGVGDMLGLAQSGFVDRFLKVANVTKDEELLQRARETAKHLVAQPNFREILEASRVPEEDLLTRSKKAKKPTTRKSSSKNAAAAAAASEASDTAAAAAAVQPQPPSQEEIDKARLVQLLRHLRKKAPEMEYGLVK